MPLSKTTLLEKAIEITKAYAGSGGTVPLEVILEKIYKKLTELSK